jgi:uncharacterized membrane protein YkoI
MSMRRRREKMQKPGKALALAVVVWASIGNVERVIAAGPSPPTITKEQATEIALKALPGKVTDITIERKRGQDVYVVEIVADKDGTETDVLVDPHSGKVLGTA